MQAYAGSCSIAKNIHAPCCIPINAATRNVRSWVAGRRRFITAVGAERKSLPGRAFLDCSDEVPAHSNTSAAFHLWPSVVV
jgi:hypothetical protein